jgi:hypothetical protein
VPLDAERFVEPITGGGTAFTVGEADVELDEMGVGFDAGVSSDPG